MYSALLLDHFQNPRHAGELPDATVTVRQENPVCGDILELSAVVRDGTITVIRFRAKGCVPSMACASAMCEIAQGMTISAAREVSKQDVFAAVGGVPNGSDHAVQLAVDVIAELLRQATNK